MRLFGRDAECATLDALIAATRAGRSAGLVLRGEAGVGKTALLRYAASRSPGTLWIAGIESEAGFPFAALHRLLVPLLDRRDRLPATQRAALEVACGLADGPPADLYLVSLAALTLIAEAPRLCVADDAQWLDRESLRALAFVGRRLHAEGVVLLFGLRAEDDDPGLLAGLDIRDIGGLAPADAAALLTEIVDGGVDPALAEHIARATGGNPLALTDLGRELTREQLSGTTPLPDPAPIGSRLEAHYSARIHGYPPATRTWLLLAAANAGGTGAHLTAAAALLGATLADAAPAENDALIDGWPPLTFRHPLVRSAVYGGATASERRAAHRALASVTTAESDADRRAWHRAAAAAGPDETVAGELERRADRAGARGGHTARATFLTRAAELTPDPAVRAARQVGAAGAALLAGAPGRALTLLDAADERRLSPADRGAALLTRSNAAVTSGVPAANRDAPAMCLAAAEAFGDDRERARAAVLQAIEHVISAEHLARTGEPEIAAAAGLLAGDDLAGLMLAAYTAFTTGGYATGAPAIHRAIAAFTDASTPDDFLLSRVVVGVNFCQLVWDDHGKQLILDRAEAAARRSGALHALDLIHFLGTMTEAILGRLDRADRHDQVGQRLRKAIGITAEQELVWRHPELVTWRAPDGVRASVGQAIGVYGMLHLGGMQQVTRIGLAGLDIADGDYQAAQRGLLPLVEFGNPRRYAWALPDLVESSLRAGDRRTAALALDDLAHAAGHSGTPRAKGLLERSTALLATADEAEAHYRLAVEHLSGTPAHGDLARAHLVYGEWLRRRRRRGDARAQLAVALAMFEEVRAHAFAARARRELRVLGADVAVRVRKENATDLTPQEAAVARLARDGGTNAEIAAHLYLSASTVDYHLRKVFRKLGVRSRRQLRGTLHD
ncbi:LuxR family transcriptional regulator [Actinoplanes sp. TBRC 11911]|uniref:helix-turn-helix transcriptional regulator n=1 Tax=Actinoplanes sp. TBRC 11911 TaxID=2729386 RepID=UPI001B7D68A0|nr:LuxR family transcriptional regulator [Actinoplanes sp. TBRC 11911]